MQERGANRIQTLFARTKFRESRAEIERVTAAGAIPRGWWQCEELIDG